MRVNTIGVSYNCLLPFHLGFEKFPWGFDCILAVSRNKIHCTKEAADLVIFTEEILYGKLHFCCMDSLQCIHYYILCSSY